MVAGGAPYSHWPLRETSRFLASAAWRVGRTIKKMKSFGGKTKMAAHESPRTTKLYDRTGDEITLDEVERIAI